MGTTARAGSGALLTIWGFFGAWSRSSCHGNVYISYGGTNPRETDKTKGAELDLATWFSCCLENGVLPSFWSLVVGIDIGLVFLFMNEASNVSVLSRKRLWRLRVRRKNQWRVDRQKSHSSAMTADQVIVAFPEPQHMPLLPVKEEEWGLPEALLRCTWRSLGSALPNCRAGPYSRGWSADRSFEYFHNATTFGLITLCVLENRLVKKYWSILSSLPVFKDKPVESVILSGKIKSRLSPLLFKNLVFLLFLKYSFSHMVSTLWRALQNQALLCPLWTRETNYKNY